VITDMRYLFAGAAIILLVSISAPLPAQTGDTPEAIDFRQAGEEALEHLKAIVRLDTSNPPGNETRIADYLAGHLREAGLEPIRFEPEPGRGSLMVRYRGNGARRPLLILSHIDVVPVQKDLWSVPPFDSVVRDGFLWGRGVLDDKGMAAAGLEVMLLLARHQMRLSRDVIFLAEADKEGGGELGMEWLLRNHADLFDCEMALNEGGRMVWRKGRVRYAAIQTTEKIYQDFEIVARGESGHSSVPTVDNPVARLVRALDRIASIEFPVHLNPVTREFFTELAPVFPRGLSLCASRLENPLEGEQCAELLSSNPNYNAMLRTTCTPTIVEGGFKENVIPSEARANLNCRILPGTDLQKLLRTINDVVDDSQVEIRFKNEPTVPPGPSPSDHFLFDTIASVVDLMAPGVPVVPYMSPGGTDSQVLRKRGIETYGLLPFPILEEEIRTMHGNDEKISVESFIWGTELLVRIVVEAAK
jgi:acetylornithine deacetylase/succinyl-diaminopimelate desuccinylase-like protein